MSNMHVFLIPCDGSVHTKNGKACPIKERKTWLEWYECEILFRNSHGFLAFLLHFFIDFILEKLIVIWVAEIAKWFYSSKTQF